jgi:hypothetical protein
MPAAMAVGPWIFGLVLPCPAKQKPKCRLFFAAPATAAPLRETADKVGLFHAGSRSLCFAIAERALHKFHAGYLLKSTLDELVATWGLDAK